MSTNWIDTSVIPFDALLLLERCQIGWFCENHPPDDAIAGAFNAHPYILWYFKQKNPYVADWVDAVAAAGPAIIEKAALREREVSLLKTIQDWLTYVIDPALYDRLPFAARDPAKELAVVDFRDKRVLDVGAGTGRLSFAVARSARLLYACEPVSNLREYLRACRTAENLKNMFVVDGTMEDLPFPDGSFDIVMGGYVFGDHMERELAEMSRVVVGDGVILLSPGNVDKDDEHHDFLVRSGFHWKRHEESAGRFVRTYWRRESPEAHRTSP
jgi:SAM-dependent methyltransferase